MNGPESPNGGTAPPAPAGSQPLPAAEEATAAQATGAGSANANANEPTGRSGPGPTTDSPGDPATGQGPGPAGGSPASPDLEADLADAATDLEAAAAAAEVEVDFSVASVARERDEYLDALRRLQADFENYKKRVDKQQREHVERAVGELVSKLLPVCDTADLAIAHGGGEEVKQVWTALMEALERVGLERIDPVGVPFDPTVHDAVAHDPGEGGAGGPEVVEVFRTGYRWKGRVLRAAMVKVKG